jgi:hypothetical protein
MTMKKDMCVSFSGGRTSAYMAQWLINNKSDEYNFHFIFANTGLEHENTLDFVNECDKKWGLNLAWVEAVVHHDERKRSTHKVVTYETASRNGEPFGEVVKKYGISNPRFKHCNRELKLAAINSYRKSMRLHRAVTAIGIRADETDRVNPNYERLNLCYPLAFWHPVSKQDIKRFWDDQDFDLGLPEHLGNCVTCWKKSDRKLMTIAKHEPERFDFMKRMEQQYGLAGAPTYDESGNQIRRKWFRKYKSCDDIIQASKSPFIEFVEITEHEEQLFLEGLDPLDETNGCSDSCEVFADFESVSRPTGYIGMVEVDENGELIA